jgi:hypothetical protein
MLFFVFSYDKTFETNHVPLRFYFILFFLDLMCKSFLNDGKGMHILSAYGCLSDNVLHF